MVDEPTSAGPVMVFSSFQTDQDTRSDTIKKMEIGLMERIVFPDDYY